jgi:hypothetical protein
MEHVNKGETFIQRLAKTTGEGAFIVFGVAVGLIGGAVFGCALVSMVAHFAAFVSGYDLSQAQNGFMAAISVVSGLTSIVGAITGGCVGEDIHRRA